MVKLYQVLTSVWEDYWSYEEIWIFVNEEYWEIDLGTWVKYMDFVCYEFQNDIWSLVLGIHLIFIVWYFMVEHCDYWMGWEQELTTNFYHQKKKYEHRNYWNVKNAHFRMMKFKFYKFLVKWLIIFLIPFYFIFPYVKKIFFKLHNFYTKIHNRFFWWKDKKYTFEEIQKQWKKDKIKLHYRKEEEKLRKKRNKGGGLRIK